MKLLIIRILIESSVNEPIRLNLPHVKEIVTHLLDNEVSVHQKPCHTSYANR